MGKLEDTAGFMQYWETKDFQDRKLEHNNISFSAVQINSVCTIT